MFFDRDTKKLLLIRGGILLICAMIFFGAILYFGYTKDRLSREVSSLEMELGDYQSKIDSFNSKTQDIDAALAIWSNLVSDTGHFNGLKITAAQDIFNELKAKYHFNLLDIRMSKPVSLGEEYARKVISMESSQINLSVKATSDIQILGFIYDLTLFFPGYIQVTSYQIKLERELDQDFLAEIAEGGKDFSLVTASIECVWSDFSEKDKQDEI